MNRWIAIGVAVVAVAVVLVIVGVGGGGNPTVPSSTISEAAAATASSPGFKLSIDGSVKVPQLNRSIPIKGAGTIDPRNKRGNLTLDLSGIGGLAGSALGGGANLKMDEVIDRYVIYMRAPFLSKNLPGGKTWVKLDLRKFGQQFGLNISQLGGAGSDPTQALSQLQAVSGKVERLGHETVRGARTTHYKAKVDLRRYPRLVPAAQRAAAQRGIDQLVRLTGTSTIPEEVWIDSQRHIRRFRLTYSFHPPGLPGSGKVSSTITEELYDFGTPVSVQTPPASDTTDLTQLAGQSAQGGLGGGATP